MKKDIIPIFFTIDNNFAPFLSVAIKSMLDHANPNYFYNVHVVHEGLTEENKAKLKTLETKNSKIIFSEMSRNLECIEDKIENKLRPNIFTLSIFFRIFIPEMFKEYDKAIYIDADTCILGDISELYNTPLDGNLIGACIDKSIVGIKPIEEYFTNGVGIDYREYINSGVLLFNMKELRNRKFDEKFLYLFNKYHFENIDPDQSYINAMCYGNIKFLDSTWDAMPTRDGKEIENPNIIHYNLFLKPWHYDGVLYEDPFWDYAKKTPYYEQILEIKNNFTESDKQKDDEGLQTMLKRCGYICSLKEGTFKDIFDNGKESRL